MSDKKRLGFFVILVWMFMLVLSPSLKAQETKNLEIYSQIDEKVAQMMIEGNIPGLSLVIIDRDGQAYIKGFGYADSFNKIPVTGETLFELASCSKAFTSLAAVKLEQEGLIDLNKGVSHYLPWFEAFYKGKSYDIKVKHFLYQTSGIPFKTISLIPQETGGDALLKTVRNLSGVELTAGPGTRYEYATINYDVLGLIIEKVSGMSFEEYMRKNILSPLGMNHTYPGRGNVLEQEKMAAGHKIGFFKAIPYEAPVFRGNVPAGYMVSNGDDMAIWMKAQLGLKEHEFKSLMAKTHVANPDLLPSQADLSNYAMGWIRYLDKKRPVEHAGDNPNFTSYVGFMPQEKIAVAVMANSDSTHTRFIGQYVLNKLQGKGPLNFEIQTDPADKFSSILSFILGFFILIVIAYYILSLIEIIKGKRKFKALSFKGALSMFLSLLMYSPFVVGVYFIPNSLIGVSMETASVWAPISFNVATMMILISMILSYGGLVISTFFPHTNKYRRSAPMLLILSVLSGGANAVVIFLVTNALFSRIDLFFQIYNFSLAFIIYIFGRKVLQTKLLRITFDIVYDMRMRLIEKIFYTSYQRFERIDNGRIFATLNDDTGQIGGAAGMFVGLITSMVTTLGAFMYLATIAFWATVVTSVVVVIIATVYSFVSRKSRVYFEDARDTRNVYMGLLNGLVDGFKELSIQYEKKVEYTKEIETSSDEFRKKMSHALIKFVNAFLIGESMLIVVLGSVGFGIPRMFPNLTVFTLMSFIMVLLYLIGPINGILHAIPGIIQLRVAWNRVQTFMADIPANMNPEDLENLDKSPALEKGLSARGITFEYETLDEDDRFSLGPLDFEAKKGEIIFIIGGNGSGKTTLAKILCGLYTPNSGTVEVDGKEVPGYQLGEYYSAVFSNFFLFPKLYNINLDNREQEVEDLIKLMRLENKVTLVEDGFNTIELSGGQRKRLALLQCYLEDRPIYMFDEVAADQDPEFRKFFYRELLPRMKDEGKIVIAVTHDDHYFDVADRVVKMDMGQIDVFEDGTQVKVTQ